MESSLIRLVYEVKKWVDRSPLELPNSPDLFSEILRFLNDRELEIKSLEIDLIVNWYVYSRMWGLLPECIVKNDPRPFTSYIVEDLLENQFDISSSTPLDFALQLFGNIDFTIFKIPHVGWCGLAYDFSMLECLPSDHRQDLLRRLILAMREFSDASHRCFRHGETHPRKLPRDKSADSQNAESCRVIGYEWAVGVSSIGVSVKSTALEILDASRRHIRARLANASQADAGNELKLLIGKIRNGQDAGRQTRSRDAKRSREVAIDEAKRLHQCNPEWNQSRIIDAMAEDKIGNRYRWGSPISLKRYLRGMKFGPFGITGPH